MAFQKKTAYAAMLAKQRLSATDLPAWLQAAIRLFHQDLQVAGGKLTDDLVARDRDIAEDIEEWAEQEEDEPVVPVVTTDPLTAEQVLMQLHGQGKGKVTAAELKAAGFRPNPGATGGSWGNYRLDKALFGNSYTLTKRR